MRIRFGHVLAGFCLMVVLPALALAAPSPVSVPNGTKLGELKYGEPEMVLTLQPEEQVAFLFLSAIWGLEQDCVSPDSGPGRLVTLGELIKGIKTPSGVTMSLSVNPVKDTNYSYDVILIGTDLLVRALPRVKGLGAFAMLGSGKKFTGNFWYSSKSADLTKAVQLTQYGYEGNGFRR
jgi:hypothetical protein